MALHICRKTLQSSLCGEEADYTGMKDKVMGMALFQTEQTATLLTAEGDLYILKSSHLQ